MTTAPTSSPATRPEPLAAESVMKGHGYYSEHSTVQHAAAAVAYPYLDAAAAAVPVGADAPGPVLVGDFGCAGGRNEMEPMRRTIEALRRRAPDLAVQVAHSDLPNNDFASLFALLYGSDESYLAGTDGVYAFATGRSLYEAVLPDESLTLGWTAITVHWLSSTDGIRTDALYPNLTTGPARQQLQERSRQDWLTFLRQRHRELVPGGQVVVVGGASRPDGQSGAEGLFELAAQRLQAMVDDGDLTAAELEAMYYPTWNRTETEFRAPFEDGSVDLDLLEARFDHSDDADSYPQWAVDHDAEAFADAYLPFVRAITEPSLFRWLAPSRTAEDRRRIADRFYTGLRDLIAAHPDQATSHWHVVSLRFRKPAATDRA